MCKRVCCFIVALCCCCLYAATPAIATNEDECSSNGKPPAHYCSDANLENGKVNVCHVPEGCPENEHTICVYVSAVDRGHNEVNHFPGAHGGDYLGICNSEYPPTPTPTPTPNPSPSPTPTPHKTEICHLTGEEPKAVDIVVDDSALPAHLAHGDHVGACVFDCAGVPFGQAAYDNCGVCGGDNSTCTDCAGDLNGNAVLDSCGVCNGQNNTCMDCFGTPNGLGRVDSCGVCRQANDPAVDSTCKDCAGTVNGTAQLDNCGVCDSDPSNNCTEDCLGILGGTAKVDACGVCGGDSSTCKDCAGTVNGTAQLDRCDVCNGTNACLDCAGIPNGGTRTDACGVCGGDGSSCLPPECPLVAIDYNTLDLITQAKIIANEKTIEYYAKGGKCVSKKLGKKISSAYKKVTSAQKKLAKAQLTGVVAKIVKAQNALNKAQAALNALLAQNNWSTSRIEQVNSLLEEYIEIVNSLDTIIAVCPGDCVDLHNKDKLDHLVILNETLYNYASEAQHSYRGFCRVTGAGHKGTRPLSDKLNGDISSCHGKDKVCH